MIHDPYLIGISLLLVIQITYADRLIDQLSYSHKKDTFWGRLNRILHLDRIPEF